MAKISKYILSLIALCAIGINSMAYDIAWSSYDVYYYYNYISSSEVELTYKPGYNSYSGNFTIPEAVTINGKTYKVTQIGAFAFRDCNELTSIKGGGNVKMVNASACYNCKNLESVNLTSVQELGQTVFSNCPKLTSYTIHEKCSKFAYNTFAESNIKDFMIYNANVIDKKCSGSDNVGTFLGKQVEKINFQFNAAIGYTLPDNAFCNMPNLKEVSMLGIKNIGDYCFSGCSNLQKVTVNGRMETIGINAFINCSSLKSIKKPNYPSSSDDFPLSLKSIGSQAFAHCTALEEFYIGKNVKTLGNNIFEQCSSINITFDNPEFTTSYSVSGILGKNGIHKVTFGNNIVDIRENVMAIDPGHTGVQIFEFSESVESFRGNSFTNQKADTIIIKSARLLEIAYPNVDLNLANVLGQQARCFILNCNATYISAGAFRGSNMNRIVLNTPKLTQINDRAFYNNANLKEINLPSSLTTIGEAAFTGCSSLTSLVIPDRVTQIPSLAFFSCSSLSNVTVGYMVNQIAADAFKDCNKINTVTIYSPDYIKASHDASGTGNPGKVFGNNVTKFILGNSITKIGNNAFDSSPNLTTISASPALTTIGFSAFANCTKLKNIDLQYITGIDDYAFDGCESLAEVNFGSNLEHIYTYAFRNCKSITSVTIPASTNKVGKYAFEQCPNLTKVTILSNDVLQTRCTVALNMHHVFGSQVKKYQLKGNGTTRLAVSLLDAENLSTTALEEVEISNVDILYSKCFQYNKNLKKVTFNDVTEISDYSFSNCASLREVRLSETLKAIDMCSFYNTGLTSITIPKSVGSMGYNAFANCPKLKSVTFNAQMPCSALSSAVFANCDNIEKVTYLTTSPKDINENNFSDDAYNHATLYVAPSMVDYFTFLKGWKNFYKIQKGINADVNKDSLVNSADVVSIYNFIIQGTASGITKDSADVNGDNEVNSADVVSVYNYIVGE